MKQQLSKENAIQLLTKGFEQNWGTGLVESDIEEIHSDSTWGLNIKRIIVVINGFDGTYDSKREGIIIDTPKSDQFQFINIVALKSGEGTYLGKCLIQKIMDGELTGNLHVYLRVPK